MKARDAYVGCPCGYCGRVMAERPRNSYGGFLKRDKRVSCDHLVPRRYGGGRINNIVIVCGRCNMLKGARTPERWVAWVTEHRPQWLGRVVETIAATGYQLSTEVTSLSSAG